MAFKPGNQEWRKRSGSPSGLLVAMRKVFGQPKDKDASEEEKNCRRLLEADLGAFFDRLQKLEAEHAKAQRDTGPLESDDGEMPDAAMDAGTQRCLELTEKLLRDLGETV